MGYACPVCATPQRDGEHLAHHLAFTAMLHGGDHEAWLDEHAPEWETADPAGLAAAVTPHADPAEYHEVFEDTTDRGRPDVDAAEFDGADRAVDRDHTHDGHGHTHRQHDAPSRGVDTAASGPTVGGDNVDPETAAAIREARELTRRMYGDDDGPGGGGGDGDGGEDHDADAVGDHDPDTDDGGTDTDDGGPDTDDGDGTADPDADPDA